MTIVLLLLNTIRLLPFVAGRHVARNRLTFGAGFCTFKYDVFSWHNRILSKGYLGKGCENYLPLALAQVLFHLN